MGFRRFELSEVFDDYRMLYARAGNAATPFCGFDYFNEKLFAGDFSVLKNRCDTKVYGWFRNSKPKLLVSHYTLKREGLTQESSLGAILVDPSLAPSEMEQFLAELKGQLQPWSGKTVAPLNGHMSLGFALPAAYVDGEKIGFFTTSQSLLMQSFFADAEAFKIARHYFAFQRVVDAEFHLRLQQEIADMPSRLSVRPISRLHFKRDVEIYNQLLNRCMEGHPGFYPLTVEEEWDLMQKSLPLILPEYFQFLLYNGIEVGFCFALPDFNSLMRNGADLRNAVQVLTRKKSVQRARIMYTGLLPHFQGRGWFKYVRHRVLLAMIQNGVKEIESSYIDEDNARTLGTVRSSGAQTSHEFLLYSMV